MTRLFVDKREVAAIPPDINSLDQVIRLVEKDHISGGTIIRQVQIDGRPLIQDASIQSLPDCIANKEKIEIFTGTLHEVALDSIQEAVAYLERVEATTPMLANSFRTSVGTSAFENLKQFYEGFYWVNLLMDRLTQSFRIPLNAGQAGGESAEEHHNKLASALKALIEAHEKKDFGLMGDLLEYEITPLVQGCKEIFAAIRGRILSEG